MNTGSELHNMLDHTLTYNPQAEPVRQVASYLFLRDRDALDLAPMLYGDDLPWIEWVAT